jgi:hypothetical protein
MATMNRIDGSENQKFKQIEGDGWVNIYLPAICAGVVMTTVLFLAVSCSKKENATSKISVPAGPALESPTAMTTTARLTETPKNQQRSTVQPARLT